MFIKLLGKRNERNILDNNNYYVYKTIRKIIKRNKRNSLE